MEWLAICVPSAKVCRHTSLGLTPHKKTLLVSRPDLFVSVPDGYHDQFHQTFTSSQLIAIPSCNEPELISLLIPTSSF